MVIGYHPHYNDIIIWHHRLSFIICTVHFRVMFHGGFWPYCCHYQYHYPTLQVLDFSWEKLLSIKIGLMLYKFCYILYAYFGTKRGCKLEVKNTFAYISTNYVLLSPRYWFHQIVNINIAAWWPYLK